MPKSLEEKFWAKVVKTDTCWVWMGEKRNGYGLLTWRRSNKFYTKMSHRFTYELLKGPIPDGLDLHHLCHNASCVNPEHLELVTSRENTLRGTSPSAINAKKTHCPKGHPLVKGNLVRSGLKEGKRQCLTCHRERSRLRQAKLRATKKLTPNPSETSLLSYLTEPIEVRA